jgi:hypothetical protein
METEQQNPDEALAAEARAVLEAGGCTGIRIEGAGDSWHVWAALASRDGIVHPACAFSARNPNTPNDPVYLAGSLLDTLRKNVAAHERGVGLPPPRADDATALVETAPGVLEAPPQEPAMAQPININVAPVFNVGGSHSESGATQSAAERAAIAESDALFDAPAETTETPPIAVELSEDVAGDGIVHPTAPETDADPPAASLETPQHETHGEAGAEAQDAADEPAVDFATNAADGPPWDDDASSVVEDDNGAEAPLGHAFTDADFEPFEADALEQEGAAEPLALEADALIFEIGDTTDDPPAQSPIAYAASDLDALVREKLGRVSQIARELKATLQDGWTLDRFAFLQNLIVRIDRGEAADDSTARAEFLAISERSQAMSRVDAHRDALEADLEAIGKARDYEAAVAFDPEAGWPLFG